MNHVDAIELARKHMGKNSSARLCLMDALKLSDKRKFEDAKRRAVDSLAHSVGIFHHDYKAAQS